MDWLENITLDQDTTQDDLNSTGSDVTRYDSKIKTKIYDIEVLVRASQVSKVMSGNFGLSEAQQNQVKTLNKKLESGKALTILQAEKLAELNHKANNPSLGATAKSYIDEIITTNLYGIEKDITSRYTMHGNANEPLSIELLNKYTSQNFSKCEQRKTDEDLMLTGLVDIDAPDLDAVIDIKNPFDTFTFDRNRDFNIDMKVNASGQTVYTQNNGDYSTAQDKVQKEYYWQGQIYMHLYDRNHFYLIYTLNENYYMEGHEYEDLGLLDRVIIKKIDRDPNAIKAYKNRLPAIKKAIEDAKLKRLDSITQTATYLMELQNV